MWDVEAKPAYDGEAVNTNWLGAGIYDGEKESWIVKDRNRFFETLVLSNAYRGFLCYAHNGSGYDFRYLIAWLCRRQIPWEGFSAGSRLFIRVNDREILDSMAVLPMSLREACDKLHARYKKHTVPVDFYERIEFYDWQTYLAGDLKALHECIRILRSSVAELGSTLKRTLASTSVDLWRRHYLDREYIVPGFDHPAENAAREAYAGGRCEVFKHEIGQGESWDINSSYPNAMLTPVPVTLRRGSGKEIPDYGLVQAVWEIPSDCFIPPLFYRAMEGRLYHPTGRWTGWRTADEARYVRSLFGKGACRVAQSIRFDGIDLFSSYVRDLYAKRLIPGPIGHVAKRLLNSLYGRTGMRREREKLICGTIPSGCMSVIDLQLGLYSEPVESMKHDGSIMPAVAASITGRGRIELHRLLAASPDPAYCDTDSVYTGGRAPFVGSTDLGGVKKEAEIASAEFVAPKAYRILAKSGKETYHAKGLASRDVSLLKKYISGHSIRVPHIPGIRESIRRHLEIDGPCENQLRTHLAGGNRHSDGRAFTIQEIGGF